MSKIHSAESISRSFAARYPNAGNGGTLDSISASADTLASVQAAGIKGFNSGTSKLVYIKATEHFLQRGEFIAAGEFVQVTEADSRQIILVGRGEIATDEEVAAAKAEADSTVVKGSK